MPSGAKKRKANKKKKAQQPHQSSHETDDPRQHEEKDSDGGEVEVLSPASQGGHRDPFPNDGAEEFEDPPPAGSHASESKSFEMEGPVDSVGAPKLLGLEENENVEIVKEVNSEDISERKTVDIECVDVEAVEIVANGAEGKANGVSLDNGSQVFEEKKVEMEEVEAVALEASNTNDFVKQIDSLPEASNTNDFVKQIDSLPEEPVQIVENTLVVDSIEPVPSAFESENVIHVTKALVEETPAGSASTLKDQHEKLRPEIDELPQVSETVPEASSVKVHETAVDATDEIAGKSSCDEKEGKLLVSPATKAKETVAVVTDEIAGKSSSDKKEGKLLVSPATNVVTDGNAGKLSSDEKEGKLSASPEAPIAQARDVVEAAKEAERPQPSENQVLLQSLSGL
ncbi:hypothetical protein CDL15_Pgr027299 [Punica granatum]|uniref:Uncharacterized protein n=1 Tax=Punica granatum TaxID=22663 RepID=A0A218XR69_PUNGR|nr:hypothetical protein CDL15_Pgr027299 [Punica granatum]